MVGYTNCSITVCERLKLGGEQLLAEIDTNNKSDKIISNEWAYNKRRWRMRATPILI